MSDFERESTDPTYTERANPPQVESTVYVCNLCSAMVENPRRHTLAVHRGAAQEVGPAARTGDPRQGVKV